MMQGEQRDEVARILEEIARDGLPHPRNLDAALDAIHSTYIHNDDFQKVAWVKVDGEEYFVDGDVDDEDIAGQFGPDAEYEVCVLIRRN